jgi:hypothetical protein
MRCSILIVKVPVLPVPDCACKKKFNQGKLEMHGPEIMSTAQGEKDNQTLWQNAARAI